MTKTVSPDASDLTLKLQPHRTKASMLFREVCLKLREHVTTLAPGTPLSKSLLSEQLGISSTPVREALIQLSNEGLVQFQGNGRCHVATLTRQDVIEMCDVRIGLEVTAARALAKAITPEQLVELRKLAVAADRAEKNARSRGEWDKGEEAFHRRLLEFAGNTRIQELLERQGLLERLLTLPMKHWRRRPRPTAPSHIDVVEALAAGDPDTCDNVIRAHTGVRKQLLLELMLPPKAKADGA